MFNNEISTHKLCPKSGLKHSVGHAQGIGIKIQNIFFCKIFFVKRCSTMKFRPINYVQNQV